MKIACKRSKVGAVLTATAASDLFTQDLEDLEDVQEGMIDHPPGDAPSRGGAARTSKPSDKMGAPPNGDAAKANPIQIRDLNLALGDLGVQVGDRLTWINENLPGDRQMKQIGDLPPDEAVRLTALAKERAAAQ